MFTLISVRFGLRGLKEQYELRRYPDSQINIVKINGKDALVYREFQSKTRQGGYQIRVRTLLRSLIVCVLAIGLGAWWNFTGNIYFLVLGGLIMGQDFMYRQIQIRIQGQITGIQIGQWAKTLWGYIEDMMKKRGIEGNFKNHSMRKSTCTRLFRKGVDPQLIKEQTGHK